MYEEYKITREQALTEACETCLAKPGEPCRGRRRKRDGVRPVRVRPHAERFQAARGTLGV